MVQRRLQRSASSASDLDAILSDVHLALGQSSEALRDINIASDLPHSDRSAIERYNVKILGVRKRIETARRERDSAELETLRSEVRAEAERREPLPQPVA